MPYQLKGNVWSFDFTFVLRKTSDWKLKLIRIRLRSNNNIIRLQCTSVLRDYHACAVIRIISKYECRNLNDGNSLKAYLKLEKYSMLFFNTTSNWKVKCWFVVSEETLESQHGLAICPRGHVTHNLLSCDRHTDCWEMTSSHCSHQTEIETRDQAS